MVNPRLAGDTTAVPHARSSYIESVEIANVGSVKGRETSVAENVTGKAATVRGPCQFDFACCILVEKPLPPCADYSSLMGGTLRVVSLVLARGCIASFPEAQLPLYTSMAGSTLTSE